MNTFLILCLILNIAIFSPCYLSYEIFVITRNSGRLQQQGDEFIVSNNYCRDDKPDCKLFRASRGSGKDGPCTCVCGVGSKTRTTLGIQNGNFRCISNFLFRTSQGCVNQYFFPRETRSEGLRAFPPTDHTESLGVLNSIGVPFSVDNKATYLYECNGTWSPIKNASEIFSIVKVFNSKDRSWFYNFIIKNPKDAFLDGRIIKLGIDYSDTKGKHTGCLLFKLMGTVKCRDETIELLPIANETTRQSFTRKTGETAVFIENEKDISIPIAMKSFNARNKQPESHGKSKRLGYLAFGFLAIGVILSAVILIGVPFMCCRKSSRKYDVKNKKGNHKGSDNDEDLSNASQDEDLNKNVGAQGRCNDGNSKAPQSKSLGDLSLYDNYVPPHMKVSPIAARNRQVNGKDDLWPSDNESYPDYHVLEGPDPNAPSLPIAHSYPM